MDRPMLRFGSKGSAVMELQQALNVAPTVLPRLKEDGDFGGKTHGRVKEFQHDTKLGVDGVVGPNTYDQLEKFLLQLPSFVANLIPPADIAAAQDRIVAAANAMFSTFGWNLPLPYTPQPLNGRIAARYCAEPASRLRQGGVILGQIFAVAGAPTSLQTVFKITADAELRYTLDKQHPKYFPNWRNNLDIVSWCGIFALFVYKSSGLKMSNWPLRYPVAQPTDDTHEMRPLLPSEAPQKGDLGILQTAENHHFLIVDVTGSQLTTIDGNSDFRFQTITQNKRTVQGVRSTPGAFLRPIWEKVLKK